MNFNIQVYQQILGAAETFLRNNLGQFGPQFANWFMTDHNHNTNGQNAQFFYNYVVQASGNTSINNNQLFQIVGQYISELFMRIQRNQQQPQMMGSPFGGNTFGGGFASTAPFAQPAPLQAAAGGFMQSSQTPSQPAPQVQTPAPQPTPQPDQIVIRSANPLDTIPKDSQIKVTVDGCNWGEGETDDRAIVFMDRKRFHTEDHKYAITLCNMFDRQYFSDPMDALQDFLRLAPEKFMAQNFIARMFYNHVETVDIDTEQFFRVGMAFKEKMAERQSHRDRSGAQYDLEVYNTIIKILEELKYGPRMAIARYLVRHINRALYLSCGMNDAPEVRISFEEIEDLDHLLGPKFQHRILDVPNGRVIISDIVNSAIINALTMYSDPMFVGIDPGEVELLKTSGAFPFSMDGVYPNKWTIPSPTNEAVFRQFKDNFFVHCRSQRTYVRSIRSIVVTNVLGDQALQQVKPKFSKVQTPWASMFADFILKHSNRIRDVHLECPEYDEPAQAPTTDEAYEAFCRDPNGFGRSETEFFRTREIPKLPVDQTVFALQYKTEPKDFLMAMDLGTTMDAPSDNSTLLLARKAMGELRTTH